MDMVYVLLLLLYPVASQRNVHVQTQIGTVVGFQEDSFFNGHTFAINKFLGIPYAEAPVGNLRFSKPVQKRPFQQQFYANEYGPGCPQDTRQMKQWIPGTPKISEDCLSLNIFAPANSHDLAVMIWFHGGAYVIGQSSIYSGEHLAGYGDVVVVTANYRLGPLGFLATDDDTSKGNYGLWDQRQVLMWVQQNIHYFGGNNNKVTIFGESAGGSSGIYHALYPQNKGLFHRVIAESGSALCPWAFASKQKLGDYTRSLAKIMHCNTTDNAQIVQCLRQKPYQDLIQYARVGTPEDTLFRSEWVPVIDGEMMRELPTKLFQSPQNIPSDIKDMFSSLDILVGMNSGDGSLVTQVSLSPFILAKLATATDAPLDVINNHIIPAVILDRYNTNSSLIGDVLSFVYTDWESVTSEANDTYLNKVMKIATDYEFFIPLRITARTHSDLKPTSHATYMFRFSHRSSYSNYISWIPGAAHGDEIPYVFGFPASMKKAYGYLDVIGQGEMMLSLQMMTYWTNFAKSGDPNSGGTMINPPWPAFNTQSEHYMDLTLPSPRSGSKMDATRTALWTHLLPNLIQNLNSTNSNNVFNFNPPVFGGLLFG